MRRVFAFSRGQAGRGLAGLVASFALGAWCLGAAAQAPAPAPGAGSAPMVQVEEVPFITTPDNVTVEMLKLAGVTARDYVLDLGSGDGRIVITAARRFGARGMGVEIDPSLVVRSRENAARAGVADRADFREQDLFKTDLSVASVITMYLLPQVNLQLRPALLRLKPGTRLVSHDWDMGDWKPDRTVTVDAPDKKIGRDKVSQLMLWVVPADVAGVWCGNGLLRGTRLELQQKYQEFTGTVTRRKSVKPFAGLIQGSRLAPTSGSRVEMSFEAAGDTLKLVDGSGAASLIKGATLRRSANGQCAS